MLEEEGDVPTNSVDDFATRVDHAAQLVRDSVIALDECEAHEANGRSDEEFRAAVRDRLREVDEGAVPETAEQDDGDDGPQITSAAGVDWSALWAEFNFDSPDANGTMAKSGTKVEEAVRVSEQGIVGDAKQIVAEAVEMGVLHKQMVTDEDGEEHPVGYVFMGGGD